MSHKELIVLMLLLVAFTGFSQEIYQFDINKVDGQIRSGHLRMGNPGDPAILINSKYMTIGSKPVLPVMGEIHFSRVNRDRWEEYLLKMKANGISIVASYILWIHHEEVEGEFEWSGNKDFRAFLELCQKHDILAVARIGPWCHAEVRNGGTPDWVFDKPGLKDRSNDPQYQKYVRRWYAEIAKQTKGLYHKDGGPIIGVQLENEYRRGPGGDAHILWLKQTARELGMDVPMYTVTGWGPASVPENEVIPLYGGYPTSPWTTSTNPVDKSNNFSFETAVNDPTIGGEAGNTGLPKVDLTGYPYFTCELGIGNQITYHRRPIIHPLDGVTISMAKVGSGSNMPGYYVFAGGSNPKGKLTSLEEDQMESGYWNRYPKISYDFQAAIRETGELAQSYHEIKTFHYFLNAFGEQLAHMQPFINEKSSKDGLQIAFRTNGKSGFLFGLNYMRNRERETAKDVSFEIKLPDNTKIALPKVSIEADQNFVWPINLKMGDRILEYATCQPVTRLRQNGEIIWVFQQTGNITPVFSFKADNKITLEPSLKKTYEWQEGKEKHHIMVIPVGLTKHIWVLDGQLYITKADIYKGQDELTILSREKRGTIHTLRGNRLKGLKRLKSIGILDEYEYSFDEIAPALSVEKVQPLNEAQWLQTNADKISSKTELYHRFFWQEFELKNTSDIQNAQFQYFTNQPFKIRVNQKWVNQTIETGTLSSLDLTGYLQKGENSVLIDFDFHSTHNSFAGQINTDYYNLDRDVVVTDTTWLSTDSYKYPRIGYGLYRAQAARLGTELEVENTGSTQYNLNITSPNPDNLNALYLNIDYSGDIAQMRQSGTLIADSFNNGTTWSTNLADRCSKILSQVLQLEISPLSKEYKVYLEKELLTEKTEVKNIDLVPEYKKIVPVK